MIPWHLCLVGLQCDHWNDCIGNSTIKIFHCVYIFFIFEADNQNSHIDSYIIFYNHFSSQKTKQWQDHIPPNGQSIGLAVAINAGPSFSYIQNQLYLPPAQTQSLKKGVKPCQHQNWCCNKARLQIPSCCFHIQRISRWRNFLHSPVLPCCQEGSSWGLFWSNWCQQYYSYFSWCHSSNRTRNWNWFTCICFGNRAKDI